MSIQNLQPFHTFKTCTDVQHSTYLGTQTYFIENGYRMLQPVLRMAVDDTDTLWFRILHRTGVECPLELDGPEQQKTMPKIRPHVSLEDKMPAVRK